jgi:hypothetical protein
MRFVAGLNVVIAAVLLFTPSSATAMGPDKTAWFDDTGLQGYTGVTTPALASNGEIEVAYIPVGVTVPKENIPAPPITPPTLPPALGLGIPVPSVGSVGGNTIGDTLAFGAVEYTVPLQSGGQPIDPTSLRAVLTLALNPTKSIEVGTGDVLACPASNTLWAAGDDQTYTQAPTYDCSPGVAVTGNYDASAHTMTFDLSNAQEYETPTGEGTGIFSLILAPGTSPTGPFTAVFTTPSSTSFSLTTESPLTGSGAGDNELVPYASGINVGSNFSLGSNPGFSLTVPSSPSSPSASASTPGSSSSPAPIAQGTQIAVAQGLSGGTQRSIAVILLLALAAGLWMGASNRSRPPRSLRTVHTVSPDSL